MSVRDYYYQHFDDLESYDKFHFASRIKNFSKSHDFDDYFKTNILDQDLASIFSNNDYSKINHIEARKPYFEKYAFHGTTNAEFALATLGNDAGIYGSAKLILDLEA